MNLVKTIRSAVDSGNVTLGTKKTLNEILTGTVDYVVVASNCNHESMEDLTRYAGLSKVEVKEFDGSSIELGEVCGKPFVVSMLAVLETEKSKPKSKRKK